MRIAMILLLCISVLAGCAAPPLATAPLDWSHADERWSILVVTTDPDGDDRVTRIWMAVESDQGVFRTNDSRWWANLQREPALRVRHDGVEHAFRVEFVEDAASRVAIDEVFLEKFGGWERTLFPQPRGETHENYGRLVDR